jgi:hypothetical protein
VCRGNAGINLSLLVRVGQTMNTSSLCAAGLPGRVLRPLVRARAGGDPVAAAGWPGRVRTGSRGDAMN